MPQFAVIFDIDGLMLDTERMARKAWLRALDEAGFPLDDVTYMRLVGITVQDAQAVLDEIFGRPMPFQPIYDRRQVYYDADIAENGILLKPGLLELLDFLEDLGVTKAIASSTPCWFAERKLALSGLGPRFPVTICREMVARAKPAPDLFLEASRQIGFPPERCVVLEDSEAGILGAHRAGMLPVMVPDLIQPSPEITALAYRVLPSLFEARAVIKELLRDGLPLDGLPISHG